MLFSPRESIGRRALNRPSYGCPLHVRQLNRREWVEHGSSDQLADLAGVRVLTQSEEQDEVGGLVRIEPGVEEA